MTYLEAKIIEAGNEKPIKNSRKKILIFQLKTVAQDKEQ